MGRWPSEPLWSKFVKRKRGISDGFVRWGGIVEHNNISYRITEELFQNHNKFATESMHKDYRTIGITTQLPQDRFRITAGSFRNYSRSTTEALQNHYTIPAESLLKPCEITTESLQNYSESTQSYYRITAE